jgi:hypothetical protein
LFLFQCWGIGGGILSLGDIEYAPFAEAHHQIEINRVFSICQSMEYWQKEHNETEGAKSRESVFSALSLVETGFFRVKRGMVEFRLGPGIGLHLLKNRVKERNRQGSWVVTDYYCLNSNPVGCHLTGAVSVQFARWRLSTGAKIGVLFLNPGEENLFSTVGNLKRIAYFVDISF